MTSPAELRIHREWMGLLQPVGLVVSPPALATAQAFPDKNILREQQTLSALLVPDRASKDKRPAVLPAFAPFARAVLGWKADKLVGGAGGTPLPDSLSVPLPELGETLRPTYAVPALREDEGDWMLLVQELPAGTSLDDADEHDGRRWRASPQIRFERLLRETSVPAGILVNGHAIRLVYAPRGESSGHITWPLARLTEVSGRPMLSALCMLLGAPRLFQLPRVRRLPHILQESRKYQAVVSTRLAGQVLEALNELLRGFVAADEASKGVLLGHVARHEPEHVYGGLLAVILRLVFLLYAEERGLLSSASVYVQHYSLVGLFEKLRADAGRFPDTMDQRYGAWARLVVLFRMIHDGARRGELSLPARHGHLFDPDGWSFLEGRPFGVRRVMGARIDVPKVPDGVILRVLEKLLLLDGDRLSYRALDVEQIGSVYENMMGFRLERAAEPCIGAGKDHVVVGLKTLLGKTGADRNRYLKETAGVELSGKALEALKAAKTHDELIAALGRRVSPLTPRTVPAGGLYLQPTDERRRSGSHYTPRELTEPIVRTTLRPILEDLGPAPRPEAILALKVCDPAMGSGAFLVEACRQLAEQLVRAYDVHGRPGDVPPDEDILLYAQRQVAQRCLYGVDKNPFAVDLGKLSLWLTTLAQRHPFTFVNHALRHGDSLVGLSREQIASFHWAPEKQVPVIRAIVDKAIGKAEGLRREIQALAASDDDERKRDLLREAEKAVDDVRLIGDAVVASFFAEEKKGAREDTREPTEAKVLGWLGKKGEGAEREAGALREEVRELAEALREGERPVPAFHWEIEFPEVFGGGRGGFDAMVGNPPFAGKNTILSSSGEHYVEWLQAIHEGAHGASDLVAHFFRRAYARLRSGGAFGLIATNTIAQGDTRTTGLRWIRKNGGVIYDATRRLKWPNLAAVVVSIVHIQKEPTRAPRAVLDGKPVEHISAFLFHQGGDDDPAPLKANARRSFQGSNVLGMGFTFDDTNPDATSLADMDRLKAKDKRNAERIFPYLGGEELNSSPTQAHHRYVINFGQMTEEEARQWPDLMAIVEATVKPERLAQKREIRARYWWRFGEVAPALYDAIRGMDRVLVCSQTSKYLSFVFAAAGTVFSHKLVVFPFRNNAAFAILQSQCHQSWAYFLGSTMKDDPVYTPSDCFETFPFPPNWESNPALEAAGKAYHEFRAALMVRNNEGLTKTYNGFHDPEESDPDILHLRELHAAMDRAVLDAYGWTGIQPTCEFLLDYEEKEDQDEEAAQAVRPGARRKKKPWRYRWPDETRDEVLARLLKLNAERARAEAAASAPAPRGGPRPPARKRPARTGGNDQGNLF